MTIAFYVVAGLAALLFLAAGAIKLLRPKSALKENGMAWVEDFSPTAVKLIGLAEVLGAVGLILPAITEIAPGLSPVAGLCLAAVMVGAAIVHGRRRETTGMQIGLAVLALAAAVLALKRSSVH